MTNLTSQGWIAATTRLPAKNSRVEVIIGSQKKKIIYTAGLKQDDVAFSRWRYIGYEDVYERMHNELNKTWRRL